MEGSWTSFPLLQTLQDGWTSHYFLSLLRPVLILVCGMLLFNLPTLIYKLRMFVKGIVYLLFCHDKSWHRNQTTTMAETVIQPLLDAQDPRLGRATIYFVRHGESTWNDTFNKGAHRSALSFGFGFIPGLIKALLFELYLVLSGKLDSWFYDSPISTLGLGQVEDLARFLQASNHKTKSMTEAEARHLAILRADPGAPQSKIVCSNLRRAVSTIVAGFRHRLKRRRQEKVLILPALQEISRNPDTLSITPAFTPIRASFTEKAASSASSSNHVPCDFQDFFDHQLDMSLHYGNKPLTTNGLKRMMDFCDFVFTPASVKESHVIVGGHSLWFRCFFGEFLPMSCGHLGKRRKMVNGGIVAFDLVQAPSSLTPSGVGPLYMIDEKSIQVVYGGWA